MKNLLGCLFAPFIILTVMAMIAGGAIIMFTGALSFVVNPIAGIIIFIIGAVLFFGGFGLIGGPEGGGD